MGTCYYWPLILDILGIEKPPNNKEAFLI